MMRLVPLLAVVALGLLPGAQAWGVLGHERIARIAEALLKGKHRDQIRTMMHGDLIDLSDWEKKLTAEHPKMLALHFHKQTPEWTCAGLQPNAPPNLQHLGDQNGNVQCDGKGADPDSLICALAYYFDHFAHDALLKEFPKPKVPPIKAPKSLEPLAEMGGGSTQSYLRSIASLIADVHQPLHWLREKDYGREVTVIYKEEQYSLFNFWEEKLPDLLPPLPKGHQLLQKVDAKYREEAARWGDRLPTEDFWDWAKVVAEKLCTEVYAAMEVNHADGTREIEQPFKVDEALLQKWMSLAEDFTSQAGIRLAFVLNDILEHRRHKVATKEGRGMHHRHKNWRKNLAINFGLALLVVPVTLLALRLHYRVPGLRLFRALRSHLKI